MRLAAITLIVTVAPFTAGTEQSATDYLERGQTQYAEGKLDEAIASFRKAIEVEPHPDLPVLVPFLHVTLSANLADGSFAAGAIAEYLMVVERKPGPHQPDLAEAYYNLGLALRDTGELNEAIGPVSLGHSLPAGPRGCLPPSLSYFAGSGRSDALARC